MQEVFWKTPGLSFQKQEVPGQGIPKLLEASGYFPTTVATRNWQAEFCISSIWKGDACGEELASA